MTRRSTLLPSIAALCILFPVPWTAAATTATASVSPVTSLQRGGGKRRKAKRPQPEPPSATVKAEEEGRERLLREFRNRRRERILERYLNAFYNDLVEVFDLSRKQRVSLQVLLDQRRLELFGAVNDLGEDQHASQVQKRIRGLLTTLRNSVWRILTPEDRERLSARGVVLEESENTEVGRRLRRIWARTAKRDKKLELADGAPGKKAGRVKGKRGGPQKKRKSGSARGGGRRGQ